MVGSVAPGGPCTLCGEAVYAGGLWVGTHGDIYVCSRECARKLLLLALDTLADLQDREPEELYASWLRFAAETFEERWIPAVERQEGRR